MSIPTEKSGGGSGDGWFVALVVVLAVGTLLVYVGTINAQTNDEQPTHTRTDIGDDWGDIAHYCNGPVGVYVTQDDTRATSAIAVLGDDPNCEVDQ